ncbi:hypothetical protein FANTH_1671 [Fusarium anthophilum]|uniref:Heterokaryon incompatibility domain-containing protein n=1 Tax=Fusarium anthophilum TaxID=48485 RepID=A0A8H4ZVD6_9HYPO|nr:hypothetical protein FANTH_1671 [Fusarium anthophilum]
MAEFDFETQVLSSLLKHHAVASIHKWLEYKKDAKLDLGTELERLEKVWVSCLNLIIKMLPDQIRRSIDFGAEYPKLAPPTAEENLLGANESMNEIRLIVLEPSDEWSAPVRCKLLVTSLKVNCPPYEIVYSSQATSRETSIVFLDEHQVLVPVPLESALRKLRQSNMPLVLWVDALCLIQQDELGCRCGIAELRTIYSRCQKVNIWLNHESIGLNNSFRVFELLCRESPSLVPQFLNDVFQNDASNWVLEALTGVIYNPWWHRAGLLQELFHGCSVQFFSQGCTMEDSVEWDALVQLLQGLQHKYLGLDFQARSELNLQLSNSFPYLVPQESLGYFPLFDNLDGRYTKPDSLEGLYSVIEEMFTHSSNEQGWILALARVGTFLGVFLTHASDKICRPGPGFPETCPPVPPETSKVDTQSSNSIEQPEGAMGFRNLDDSDVIKCWIHVLEILGVHSSPLSGSPGPVHRSQCLDKILDHGLPRLQILVLYSSASSKSKLEGRTLHVDLDRISALGVARCPYLAVSHIFSHQKEKAMISLQGKNVTISHELGVFLRSLRRPESHTCLHIQGSMVNEGLPSYPWLRPLVQSRSGHLLTCRCHHRQDCWEKVNKTAASTIYNPIDSARGEIRLLTILSGWRTDPIRCYLHSVSMDDSPSYEALSYVWGESSNRGEIFLDCHTFSVTSNLASALKYLRHRTKQRTLWIDALCINQIDIGERNSQVQLMGRIYREARQVISWLGERVEGAERAYKIMSETKNCELTTAWFRERLSDSNTTVQRQEVLSLATLLSLKVEYWCRVWITQEVALAKKGVIQFDEYTVDYTDVRRFSEAFRDYLKVDAVSLTQRFGADSYAILRDLALEILLSDIQTSGAENTLLNILRRNRHKNATDLRDKVYALIGLSDLHLSSHPGLQIDYSESRTILNVYTGVVQAIVDETSQLDIICESTGRQVSLSDSGSEVHAEMPSWVPDWRCEAQSIPFQDDPTIRAAKSSPAAVGFSPSGDILIAAGFCVGTIAQVAETLPSYESVPSEAKLAEIVSIAQSWYKLARKVQVGTLDLDKLFNHTVLYGISEELVRFLGLTDDESREWSGPSEISASLESSMTESQRRDTIITGFYRRAAGSAFILIDPVDKDRDTDISTLPLMGLGFPRIQQGDKVCILLGCKLPVVIRPTNSGYIYVSALYIESLMRGEAMDGLEERRYEMESFNLC